MPTQSENKLNQCQGCQAGWPIVKHLLGLNLIVHLVEGGYLGEIVTCTKHLYAEHMEADT